MLFCACVFFLGVTLFALKVEVLLEPDWWFRRHANTIGLGWSSRTPWMMMVACCIFIILVLDKWTFCQRQISIISRNLNTSLAPPASETQHKRCWYHLFRTDYNRLIAVVCLNEDDVWPDRMHICAKWWSWWWWWWSWCWLWWRQWPRWLWSRLMMRMTTMTVAMMVTFFLFARDVWLQWFGIVGAYHQDAASMNLSSHPKMEFTPKIFLLTLNLILSTCQDGLLCMQKTEVPD